MTDEPPEEPHDEPLDESYGRVQDRNAVARNLIARKRYRDALDLLNQTILLSPSEPRSFLIRAEAFEGLGMEPQAEADREHARRLAASQGLSDEDLVEEPPQPPASGHPRPRVRTYRRRGAGLSETIVIIAFILFLVAAVAGGSLIILDSLDITSGDDDGNGAVAQPTTPGTAETAAPIDTGAPGETPGPSLPPGAVTGSPYSLASLQRSWQAKGMTVTVGGGSTSFTGFRVAPTDVTLSRAGASTRVAVLVYPNADSPQQDWNLVAGQRPEPKPGHTVPAHFSIWWNTNIIVVAITDPGALGADALDGVLSLAP